MTGREKLKEKLPTLSLVAIIVAGWELACLYLKIPEYILPAPTVILASLYGNIKLLLSHTGVTFTAVLPGLSLAIVIAPLLAILMNRFVFLKKAIYPLLVVSQAVPIFAVAPLILIWFGVGLLPKILIVALVCFFPLTINLVEGFDQVDPEAVELMKTMQADNLLIIRSVHLPFTLPYFFSGLKIAASYSILGAIIGEWLAARAGLGIFMLRAMHSFRTADLFAAVILVAALSLLLFKAVEVAGRLAMPWQRAEKNSF